MASPLGSLIEGFGKGFDISDTASAAAAFRTSQIQQKRLAIAQQKAKLQKAKKVQGAFDGLVKVLELPADSPFKLLAVTAQLKLAGIKTDDPIMKEWVKALAKGQKEHNAFVLDGFNVRRKEDITLDPNAVARQAALDPAGFIAETTKLKELQKRKALIQSALREGGEKGSTGQLKAGIKLLLDSGHIKGAAELQKLLRARVDREVVEAGETRAAQKREEDASAAAQLFLQREKEREEKRVDIRKKRLELTTAEQKAMFGDDALGEAQLGLYRAMLERDYPRMLRRAKQIKFTLAKQRKEAAPTSLAKARLAVEQAMDDHGVDSPQAEEARRFSTAELAIKLAQAAKGVGPTDREKSLRLEIGRLTTEAIRGLGKAMDKVEKSSAFNYGLAGGFTKLWAEGVPAILPGVDLEEFKSIRKQIEGVKTLMSNVMVADKERFPNDLRLSVLKLANNAGEWMKSKGDVMLGLTTLQALMISRLADVSVGGFLDIPHNIDPYQFKDRLVQSPTNPNAPYSQEEAARLGKMLWPKGIPQRPTVPLGN